MQITASRTERRSCNVVFEGTLKLKGLEDAVQKGLGSTDYAVENHAITFDLSRSHFYELGASLWLILLLRKLKRQGNVLQLLLPDPIFQFLGRQSLGLPLPMALF